ncbi:helix-turn-helix domain-containing protein [Microbacterium sp. 22296]|uniref:helix-turn-helix domain-containing protein n=1 Tax=Microbacterium sp. 22296 TaxID=3453903 RepID=UPI003F82ECAC
MDAKTMDERFSEAFRLARQVAGLSQAEVAAQMADFGYEMAQPVIGKIERGERRVSIGEGEALSSIVGRTTRSLLEGPQTLRIELGAEHVRLRRSALIEAVERFQSAQMALAQALDTTDDLGNHRWSTFAANTAELLLRETPRDVLDAYEKDTQAAMTASRLRDQMDEGSEEYDARDLLSEGTSPHLFHMMQSRGDAIDSRISARGFEEAWSAMRGGIDGHGATPNTA